MDNMAKLVSLNRFSHLFKILGSQEFKIYNKIIVRVIEVISLM